MKRTRRNASAKRGRDRTGCVTRRSNERGFSTNASGEPAIDDFQKVFAAAPVSLWIEDYSSIKTLLDSLRGQGVVDLTTHLATHPDLSSFGKTFKEADDRMYQDKGSRRR